MFTAIRRDSVPVQLIGRQVRLRLHTNDLVIFDHYLEALIRKPGALPGATALEHARAAAGTRVNNVRREHL